MIRKGDTYFSEPSAHIVPPDADDVPTTQSPSAGVITRAVLEQLSIPITQVVHEAFGFCCICAANAWACRRFLCVRAMTMSFRVPANEPLVALADDPSLAASVERSIGQQLTDTRTAVLLDDCSLHHCAHYRVHPRTVSSGGKHRKLHLFAVSHGGWKSEEGAQSPQRTEF